MPLKILSHLIRRGDLAMINSTYGPLIPLLEKKSKFVDDRGRKGILIPITFNDRKSNLVIFEKSVPGESFKPQVYLNSPLWWRRIAGNSDGFLNRFELKQLLSDIEAP